MTIDTVKTPRTRIVLITGIGKPGQVGSAVAEAFVTAGAHVVLVGRHLEESRARGAELPRGAAGWSACAADLSRAADAERLADEVRRDHGDRLDAVIHLAGGWAPGSSVADSTAIQWEQMLNINLLTAVYATRSLAPLVRNARGAFVFVASEAALPGARVAGMAPYAVAKQGVVTLMRAVAEEERPNGVRANALAPAAIRTASNEAGMGANVPYVEREEVAATVVWLCSPAASAVSGELIHLAASPPDKAGR